MHGIVLGDLTIDVEEGPGAIALHWKGLSNSRDPATGLRSFFAVTLAEAATRKATLELHFEKLQQINSSTIATLLRFIEQAGERKVPLAFFYDASLRWQSHNFEAIGLLAARDGGVTLHRVGSSASKEGIQLK